LVPFSIGLLSWSCRYEDRILWEQENMTQTALALDNVQTLRDQSAQRVRELMKEWSSNTLEIGIVLAEAKATFPVAGPKGQRPGWRTWLKDTGIGRAHADSLINVAEKFGHLRGKQKLPSAKVLSFLARKTTPGAARKEVLRLTKQGRKIGTRKAHQIADKHRPKPAQANKQAKETGKPVLASDGYLYFGTSKQQAKQGEMRRSIVYSVRRAVECLATVALTPHQFLSFALPHQLWTSENEQQIGQANKWLHALSTAWETRK
jgi:hypothetical protein